MLDFSMRTLEVFCAVAKYRSFTTAADELYISQSSVSKIISRFESALDVQLFLRSSHSVELTAAGSYLYKELVELLPKLQAVFENLDSTRNQIKERICLSIPNNICQWLINEFTSAYRNIQFSISHDYDSFVSFNALMRNDAALWITHSLLIPEDYKKHIAILPVHDDPVYVVLPNGHPLAGRKSLSVKDLKKETIICHSGHIMAMVRALSVNTGTTLTFRDLREALPTRVMCLVAVCSGQGISLFYRSDFEMLSTEKITAVPLEEAADSKVVAAYDKNRKLEEHELAILDYFSQHWINY